MQYIDTFFSISLNIKYGFVELGLNVLKLVLTDIAFERRKRYDQDVHTYDSNNLATIFSLALWWGLLLVSFYCSSS